MMNIFIFEDNKHDYELLHDLLLKFFNKYYPNQEVIIKTTINPEEIYININQISILFLDIEVCEHDGIMVGKQAKLLNKDIKTIITSSYSKYLVEGYSVRAERYFIKPMNEIRLELELKKVVNDILKNHLYYYDANLHYKKIYYKDILYIEYIEKRSVIYLHNQAKIASKKTLAFWVNKLPDEIFIQTHRSFIVNSQKISAIVNKQKIEINYGYEIPISRSYRKSFEKKYLNCISEWS